MAASSSGSGSSSSTARASRSAVKKAGTLDAVESTPTKKSAGKQKSLAAIARSSAAGKHAAKTASIPPSPLHPSLPRPPSWQQSLAAHLDSEHKSPRRKSRKRTSVDERDPGDSVDSTEDEGEADAQLTASQSMLLAASRAINSSVNNNNTTATASSDEKQNICVCVRIRPSAAGAAEEDAPIWELDEQAGRIAMSENHPIMEKRKNVSEDAYDFNFDALLLPPHPTATMYEGRISQVVLAAKEGYNGTIFSYGQTGSGKTHTMTGSDDEPGILPLAISDIFHRISADNEREYLLRVSYLEIYNETLKDLLDPVKQKNQELRLTEDNRGRIVVNHIKEEIVNSPQDVLRVLTKGEDNRSVNCTDWNQRSSRSHCVFSMIIESRPRSTSESLDGTSTASRSSTPSGSSKPKSGKVEVRISQLNLIDLAGSERATSQEERRKEGAFINKSLLSLSNVIHKLADEKSSGAHIPYRDSKLTRLLQTSLSGNARIAIVCTISPEARHGTESVSTLKFAQRASKVITKAECGVVTDGSGALLANLQETIANLQAQLAKSEAQSSVAVSDGALESEKQARQKAEEEAREQRMKVIQLTDQIAHLQRQILTGTAESSDQGTTLPRTPSSSTRHYGELSTGARPTGQKGSNRRLSELAFGLASPARLSGLPASSSMRSISSALETIHSPGLPADDENISHLEEELAGLKVRSQEEQQLLRAKMAEMEAKNERLTADLTSTEAELKESRQRVQQLDRQVEEGAMTITILREEVAICHETKERLKQEQQSRLCAVQAQITDLQKVVDERNEQVLALQKGKSALSSDTSAAVAKLQGELVKARQSLQASADDHRKFQEAMKALESREISQSTELVKLSQKLASAEASLQERESHIETMHKEIADLNESHQNSQRNADQKLEKIGTECIALKDQLKMMEREHALEAAGIDAEYREKFEHLKASLRSVQSAVEQHKATISEHEQTISNLRSELEKKEQSRIRLAQLKAANTAPDFVALQAKMQAVSGHSTSKGLNSSLSSSTGSQHAPISSESDADLTSLRAELEATKTKLHSADKANCEKDVLIRQLEQRILDLESSIAVFRQKIDKNQALLIELDTSRGLIQKLETMAIREETPEPKSPVPPSKSSMPLGAMSPHRASAASYRPNGFSTPTKKDSRGYTMHAKPPPLPLPPGTPEWRKQRRETREHEMTQLRSGGIASRTRSLLQSPRQERPTLDWTSRSHVDNESTENSPRRFKKSSAGSVRSQY